MNAIQDCWESFKITFFLLL